MKDYKRLTKWSELGTLHVFDINGKEIPLYDVSPVDTDNLAGRLADFEDKIESGEIDYVADRDKEIARLTAENERLREEVDSLSHENDELEYKTEKFEAENAELKAILSKMETVEKELKARLEKAVELPCKVGDKVYGVGLTDCEDSRTTDEKKKRQIFNVCMKMGGNCEKCKYRRPQIEEFVCTHIQLGDCGIEGKSILIVGDRNENYTANNVFTTSEAAEARLNELKGEKK